MAGLIKALRASKDDKAVIERALEETRKEIKSKDLEVKATAILKLVYVRCVAPAQRVHPTDSALRQLEMLGYSIAFASFAIVECMSSVKYHIKTIGYLAASQCFDRETEVAVLVVNLVKKVSILPHFARSPAHAAL